MYLGNIGLIFSFFIVLVYRPEYYEFWSQKQYLSLEQMLLVLLLSLLFYVFQESLSTALENLKAGTVAAFSYISVIIYHFGFRFYNFLQHGSFTNTIKHPAHTPAAGGGKSGISLVQTDVLVEDESIAKK